MSLGRLFINWFAGGSRKRVRFPKLGLESLENRLTPSTSPVASYLLDHSACDLPWQAAQQAGTTNQHTVSLDQVFVGDAARIHRPDRTDWHADAADQVFTSGRPLAEHIDRVFVDDQASDRAQTHDVFSDLTSRWHNGPDRLFCDHGQTDQTCDQNSHTSDGDCGTGTAHSSPDVLTQNNGTTTLKDCQGDSVTITGTTVEIVGKDRKGQTVVDEVDSGDPHTLDKLKGVSNLWDGNVRTVQAGNLSVTMTAGANNSPILSTVVTDTDTGMTFTENNTTGQITNLVTGGGGSQTCAPTHHSDHGSPDRTNQPVTNPVRPPAHHDPVNPPDHCVTPPDQHCVIPTPTQPTSPPQPPVHHDPDCTTPTQPPVHHDPNCTTPTQPPVHHDPDCSTPAQPPVHHDPDCTQPTQPPGQRCVTPPPSCNPPEHTPPPVCTAPPPCNQPVTTPPVVVCPLPAPPPTCNPPSQLAPTGPPLSPGEQRHLAQANDPGHTDADHDFSHDTLTAVASPPISFISPGMARKLAML
jgi:hypothetical protein